MKKDFLSINIFLKPKNNLSFVGCKRLILTSSTHTKTPITPNILDQFSYTQLNEKGAYKAPFFLAVIYTF